MSFVIEAPIAGRAFGLLATLRSAALLAIVLLMLGCGGGTGGDPSSASDTKTPAGDTLGTSAKDGSGTQGTDSVGTSGDPLNDARQRCVDRINAFRKLEGLPPYQRWLEAESCSDGEAESDSKTGKPHGAFPSCGESAQNECPGWGSIDQTISGCLQQMYNEGPGSDFSKHGHYINMTSTKYSKVACGFYVTSSGKVWAVQNFR